MSHIKRLKAGQAIPLFSDYQIRLIQAQDLTDIKVMLADPQVTEYLFFAPAPDEVYDDYFNPMIDEINTAVKAGRWPDNLIFIMLDKDQHFAGMIGLTPVPLLEGNYDIGFQLPQANWNKGITSHACDLVSKLAFEQLAAHKITADCYATNTGSYQVLLKSGYQQEGMSKGYYKTEKGLEDKLYLGLSNL